MDSAWELTRRLARRDYVQVMKRDAYGRLDTNSYASTYRVSPVSPTVPWALLLADAAGSFRYLCFDFDGKTNGVVDAELMERAADQADVLCSLLADLGIDHVLCESSGTGGRHVWIAVRDGADAALVKRIALSAAASFSQLDYALLNNPARGCVRPPLSPHRDGSFSRILSGDVDALLSPTTTTNDLVALEAVLDERRPELRPQDNVPAGPVDARHRAHRELSAAGAALMATIGGGNDPSLTGYRCLVSAAAAGWSFADVEHAVATAPGMEHYRTKRSDRGERVKRSPRDAAYKLTSQWANAQARIGRDQVLPQRSTPIDTGDLEDVVSSAEGLLTHLRVSAGRWGASEAASNQESILRAVTYLMLHTGKPAVAASIRDLALLSGLGKTTAASALRALADAGYLEQTGATEGANAAEWRVSRRFSTAHRAVRSQPLTIAAAPTLQPEPERSVNELLSSRAVMVRQLENQFDDQRHDVFSRPGLGHLAGKLYALLADRPSVTIETAAELLGYSLRHVTTILSRLRTHKLIVKAKDGWSRSKQDLRNAAARACGVTGLLERRAESYRIDREVWEWWLAESARMNAAPRKRPRRRHVTSRPLFTAASGGERLWPIYPRGADGRGDHRIARQLVTDRALNPESLFQFAGDDGGGWYVPSAA